MDALLTETQSSAYPSMWGRYEEEEEEEAIKMGVWDQAQSVIANFLHFRVNASSAHGRAKVGADPLSA
jgi:hypothetical protein